MFKIIKNDFWIMRRYLIFICFYSFFFSLFLKFGSQTSVLSGISAYMFIVGLISWEERDKVNYMYKTLPLKPSAIIGAKYVETFIITLLSLIFCSLAYPFFTHFAGNMNEELLFNWGTIIYSILLSVVLLSVLLPILYKWGYVKSRIAVVLSIVVVFGLGSSLYYFADNLQDKFGNIVVFISVAATAVILVVSKKLSEKFFIQSDL